MSQSPQKSDKESTGIFINYRRADTSGYAGRLEQELSRRFPGRVFMDIHTIEAGTDFAEAINNEVGKCGALVVLIGDQWLDITDPKTGKRRLDNPNDFVALEIAEALKRDTRVIPVLVEGAKMPDAEELPASLVALGRRNAIEISDTRWDYDVEQLVKVLEKICGIPSPSVSAPGTGTGTGSGAGNRTVTGTGAGGKSGMLKIAIPIAAVIIAAVALVIYLLASRTPSQLTSAGSPAADQPPSQATPNNATSQTQRPDDFQGEAVVNLQKSEAVFWFPLEPTGDWTWYLNQPPEDQDEYHWDVEVKGGDKDYKITVYLEKYDNYAQKKGTFRALVAKLDTGVQVSEAGADNYSGDPDVFKKEHQLKFIKEVMANGLQITLTGPGVKEIFGHTPPEVTLSVRTPKEVEEREDVVDVKY